MKTAILISGQPRDVAENWRSTWDYFISNFPNPDVFIYTSQEFKVPSDFFDTLNPVKYVVEPQIGLTEMEVILEKIGYFHQPHQEAYLQQIYGWKKVWELKEGDYDMVVRLRPDLIFLRNMPFSMYHLDKITNLSCELCIGPSHFMKHYFSMFDWLKGEGASILFERKQEIIERYTACNSETLLCMYLSVVLGIPYDCFKMPPEYTICYDYYRIARLHREGSYGPVKP